MDVDVCMFYETGKIIDFFERNIFIYFLANDVTNSVFNCLYYNSFRQNTS